MLICSISGRAFRPTKGQGWYQAERHKPGTRLNMKVVHPDEVRKGWKPTDWLGRGPEHGYCGILERV